MGKFDYIIKSVSERFMEDEQWRSNLDDSESKIVMDWALTWLARQIGAATDPARADESGKNELARVRGVAKAINSMAKKRGSMKLADVVKTIETALPAQPALPRDETKKLAEKLAAAWKLSAHK